jgi:hypothetical protein
VLCIKKLKYVVSSVKETVVKSEIYKKEVFACSTMFVLESNLTANKGFVSKFGKSKSSVTRRVQILSKDTDV